MAKVQQQLSYGPVCCRLMFDRSDQILCRPGSRTIERHPGILKYQLLMFEYWQPLLAHSRRIHPGARKAINSLEQILFHFMPQSFVRRRRIHEIYSPSESMPIDSTIGHLALCKAKR